MAYVTSSLRGGRRGGAQYHGIMIIHTYTPGSRGYAESVKEGMQLGAAWSRHHLHTGLSKSDIQTLASARAIKNDLRHVDGARWLSTK